MRLVIHRISSYTFLSVLCHHQLCILVTYGQNDRPSWTQQRPTREIYVVHQCPRKVELDAPEKLNVGGSTTLTGIWRLRLAIFEPEPIAIPASAMVRAGESLILSPIIATSTVLVLPLCLGADQCSHGVMSAFCEGRTLEMIFVPGIPNISLTTAGVVALSSEIIQMLNFTCAERKVSGTDNSNVTWNHGVISFVRRDFYICTSPNSEIEKYIYPTAPPTTLKSFEKSLRQRKIPTLDISSKCPTYWPPLVEK